MDIYSEILKEADRWGEKAAKRTRHFCDPKMLDDLWLKIQQSKNIAWIQQGIIDSRYRGATLAWFSDGKVDSVRAGTKSLIGIDGSQIYSPTHSPIIFGWVTALAYQLGEGIRLHLGQGVSELLVDSPAHLHKAIVDLGRDLFELKTVGRVIEKLSDSERGESIFLLDGSLLPWITSSRHGVIMTFIEEYLEILRSLTGVQVVSLISNPRSRAVINLANLVKQGSYFHYEPAHGGIRDRDVLFHVLKDGERSPIFMSGAELNLRLTQLGAEIYFVYIRIGSEIMRIEFPGWIARDRQLVNSVCASVVEGCQSLNYPYVLAKAHDMVVIRKDVSRAMIQRAEQAYLKAGGRLGRMSAKNRLKGIKRR